VKTLLRGLWHVLRAPLLALAFVVLWIEEWGWRPLSAWFARLGRWPPVAWLEVRIQGASPPVALVLFLVPALLLFPAKLAALWLIHEGETMLGVAVLLVAKVLGTALVGRLFVLCEPQLMQFGWISRLRAWWLETRARIAEAANRSVLWQGLRRSLRWLRAHLRRSR